MRFYFFLGFVLLLWSCSRKDVDKNTYQQLTPRVVNVYPTADTLPENLLRFYIQFSHSMKAVNNLENIKLMDATGKEIQGAIFNNVYELWDKQQKQLTLIIDPARVKTGLVANKKMGRALKPGKYFKLVIEKAEDIEGHQLDTPYLKEFFVKKVDISIPDTKNWTIYSPKSNSKSPMRITFLQSLDRMSLFSKIRLLNAKQEIIQGSIKVTNLEKEWQFTPYDEWETGNYILQINSRLEDPAGNNLNGLFDHKIGSLKNKQEGKLLQLKVVII